MSGIIVIGRDELITLTGLYDNVLASYVNDATVSGSLKDENETEVTTIDFDYVATSNGNVTVHGVW